MRKITIKKHGEPSKINRRKFIVDVGKKETIESMEKLRSELAGVSVKDLDTVGMIKLFGTCIDSILGHGAWDFCWEESGHNVNAIVKLLSDISEEVNRMREAQQKELKAEYGL